MWRAASMVWVDIMLHRRFVAPVMGLLASSRSFEIQPMNEGEQCGVPDQFKHRLQALQTQVRAYQAYLPEDPGIDSGQFLSRDSLEEALPEIESAVATWIDHVHLPSTKIKALRTRLFETRFLVQCLKSITDNSLLLETFNQTLKHRAFIGVGYAPALASVGQDSGVLLETYPLQLVKKAEEEPDTVFVGLFPAESVADYERNLRASGASFAKVPLSLKGSPHQAVLALECDLLVMEKHVKALTSEIEWHSEKDQISGYLRQIQRWMWLVDTMRMASCDVRFVQICGWVPHKGLEALETMLQTSGEPYLLQSSQPAGHGEPPVLLDNPPWFKPFENFVRGFGVPRAGEIDPTPLLGVTTPLMFGYMFGDVGQGLVLALLGYLLRERLPILALFIPAGISAMLFGFLYGSIFSYEELLPPLWLHPMHEPLTVMGIALAFGAMLLIASLVLGAIQSWWNGQMDAWLAGRLPLLVLALALPLMFVHLVAGIGLALVAVIIAVIFGARRSGHSGALLGALKFIEDGIQLAMNMLSFIRLGAFTLAHGGLSAAVMVLTLMPDNLLLRLLIFIAGNVLVIALEGLVVSIQTTRLVMFEFFRRFLEGSGRPFNPLTDPVTS